MTVVQNGEPIGREDRWTKNWNVKLNLIASGKIFRIRLEIGKFPADMERLLVNCLNSWLQF